MTAAPTGTAATTTGTSVARSLLSIQLFRGTTHLTAILGAHRALTKVGLIHHHRIVKQLLAYRGSQLSWVDLVGANLLARDIVDGKIHLAPAFFFVDRAIDGSAILLSTLVCCTTT